MEEQRNAKLPPQVPVASAEEYAPRFNAGVTEYMAFLRDHEILTVQDYMDPAPARADRQLQPRPARVLRRGGLPRPRGHAHPRLPLVRQGLDGARAAIRARSAGSALLYNIFNTRTEGHATGWEELMMQAGMFDARPRSRELVYILVAAAGRAGPRRAPHAQQRDDARAGRRIRLRQHAARLAAHGRQPRPRRAAPLPPAARLRDELPDRQDRDREAPRGAQAAARRGVHA